MVTRYTTNNVGWFHHVLTELAFLGIRSTQNQTNHGIIPVLLSGDGIEYLSISGVPLWLKLQEKSSSKIHECQTLHKLFFKILHQIYTDNYQEIDIFERCYTNCVQELSQGLELPSQEEFESFVLSQLRLGSKQIVQNNLATFRGQWTTSVL